MAWDNYDDQAPRPQAATARVHIDDLTFPAW